MNDVASSSRKIGKPSSSRANGSSAIVQYMIAVPAYSNFPLR
jgi:hypothetical protein